MFVVFVADCSCVWTGVVGTCLRCWGYLSMLAHLHVFQAFIMANTVDDRCCKGYVKDMIYRMGKVIVVQTLLLVSVVLACYIHRELCT